MNAPSTDRPDRPDRPVMVPQVACHADGGCYVAEIGSQAAQTLARLPALGKSHDPDALGPPTSTDTAEFVAAAGEQALAGGWVQRADGHWLCPAHADVYLDSEPRRFTATECIHRHRNTTPADPATHPGCGPVTTPVSADHPRIAPSRAGIQ